jgi:hypothetical protein
MGYNWSQILQNAVANNTDLVMPTPGVQNPGDYGFDQADLVHNGQVLQRSQFGVSWHSNYSYATLRNSSGRDWAARDFISLVVASLLSTDPTELARRVSALETTSADHERRIAALEAARRG